MFIAKNLALAQDPICNFASLIKDNQINILKRKQSFLEDHIGYRRELKKLKIDDAQLKYSKLEADSNKLQKRPNLFEFILPSEDENKEIDNLDKNDKETNKEIDNLDKNDKETN